MKTAIAHLRSQTRYSQSKYIAEAKKQSETHDDWERRVWKQRCHADKEGHLFIPRTAFKNALSEAARYRPTKVKGGGAATYTKHIEAGIIVDTDLVLPETLETVPGEWLYLNADGKRGGGKRVPRCMPYVEEWEGEVVFLVLDEIITPAIFKQTLVDAGRFVGIGRFRPRNNGYYGRFEVVDIQWS